MRNHLITLVFEPQLAAGPRFVGRADRFDTGRDYGHEAMFNFGGKPALAFAVSRDNLAAVELLCNRHSARAVYTEPLIDTGDAPEFEERQWTALLKVKSTEVAQYLASHGADTHFMPTHSCWSSGAKWRVSYNPATCTATKGAEYFPEPY